MEKAAFPAKNREIFKNPAVFFTNQHGFFENHLQLPANCAFPFKSLEKSQKQSDFFADFHIFKENSSLFREFLLKAAENLHRRQILRVLANNNGLRKAFPAEKEQFLPVFQGEIPENMEIAAKFLAKKLRKIQFPAEIPFPEAFAEQQFSKSRL